MQQPETRCSNSEQHRTATQKTKTEQPKKKKKNPEHQPRKHLLINPENTNPQQKIFHRRTNLEKTENESRDKPNQKTQKTDLWCRDQQTQTTPMLRSSNPWHFDPEIVNFGFGFLLQFRDHDFWVWDFKKMVWMFEEGEEEEGRTVLG